MVEFSLFEGNSNQLEDEMSHGRIDLMICFEPIPLEGVTSLPLTRQRLMLVVPKTFINQLFGEDAQRMREVLSHGADITSFESLPFILIKKGNRTRSVIDQCFRHQNFKPNLILETENTVTTLCMAQTGVGITICPDLFLQAMPSVTGEDQCVDIFPLNDPSSSSSLVVAYRQDRYLSHFGERFVKMTQDVFRQDTPPDEKKGL